MGKIRLYVIIALCWAGIAQAAAENYPIRGRVIDRIARTPVAYASVVIVGQGDKGASADAEGNFVIENVKPGIYRLEASMLGYTSAVTPEYIVSAATLPEDSLPCGIPRGVWIAFGDHSLRKKITPKNVIFTTRAARKGLFHPRRRGGSHTE